MYRRHVLRASASAPSPSRPAPLLFFRIAAPCAPAPFSYTVSVARSYHASRYVSARIRSPWEVLGVPPNADETTIKKAWRVKAKEYHPDLNNGDKSANDRFVEAKLAYEAMLSPDKRAQWEMQQRTETQRSRGSRRSAPQQPRPDAPQDEMRQFWRDFEKIFQDMDQVKKNSKKHNYQRVKVEFKKPFRGSEFSWSYEEEEPKPKKKQDQPRQAQGNRQGGGAGGGGKARREKEKEGRTVHDFFSSVFESFFSDSMPRAEWKEFDFLPSSFLVHEGSTPGEFEVMGDALSFGSVRLHAQDRNLLEYLVNGKVVARGALTISSEKEPGRKYEVLTIYDARGPLLGTVTGPETNKWLHTTKTYDGVDHIGRLLFTIDKSLVLFNKLIWFDEHSRPIGGATRSRVSSRAPFQFSFSYQPDDIHPAFFVLPLVAFREDRFVSSKGLSAAIREDFRNISKWLGSGGKK